AVPEVRRPGEDRRRKEKSREKHRNLENAWFGLHSADRGTCCRSNSSATLWRRGGGAENGSPPGRFSPEEQLFLIWRKFGAAEGTTSRFSTPGSALFGRAYRSAAWAGYESQGGPPVNLPMPVLQSICFLPVMGVHFRTCLVFRGAVFCVRV